MHHAPMEYHDSYGVNKSILSLTGFFFFFFFDFLIYSALNSANEEDGLL